MMDKVKHVLHRIAEVVHPHSKQDPPPADQQQPAPDGDIFKAHERAARAPKDGSMETKNPMAGTAEPPPSLSAGPLKSPQFLGTEVEYFKEARRMLESARAGDMLLLQMYEIENEATNGDKGSAKQAPAYADQQALLPDLAAAAARGVKVEVILDASKEPRTGEIRNDPVMQYLQAAAQKSGNITADYYPPETVNIDHAKELIHLTPAAAGGFEVEEALVGGSNWGNHTPANDDGGGTFFGSDAMGATQIFFRDQAFSRGDRSAPAVPAGDDNAAVQWRATSPHVEGGGSPGIRDAKLELTNQAAAVYLNEFCLTHPDLVDATCAKGANAHVRVDPNEFHVNKGALQQIRKAGGQALWANTVMDVDHMPAQKNHEKLDVYVDASGVPFALTIGSANDTDNGLEGGSGTVTKTTDFKARRANHEIDAIVHRFTSPDGSYSTNAFLDAALAKTRTDLEQRSLEDPPKVITPTTPGNF